jgi:DNA-binding MarR family transcriptional regulator
MSSRKNSAGFEPQAGLPMIGSLLRLPREHVVARMLSTVNAQGFDVSLTELGVFMYPGPHGRRPIELARQCNMSRQAMNYVLAELERRGYLLRRPGAASNSTELQLTDKGQQMYALMRSCVAAVELEWKEHLGEQRFNALRETLQELSTWLGNVD